MFLGYSTQHAGDVYRFLHMKTNHTIHSLDLEWLGKMWHEFYNVPSNHSADAYVDTFDNYIDWSRGGRKCSSKEHEPVEQENIHDSSLEEEEPIAARTRGHDSEPIATRT